MAMWLYLLATGDVYCRVRLSLMDVFRMFAYVFALRLITLLLFRSLSRG